MCNIPNFGRCYFRFVLATKNLWFSLVVKDNILNVYCQTLSQGTLFVVLQSTGHEVEQIGATAEILERLLERRMQCHLHTSPDPIANKLIPAEVDLLDILLHVLALYLFTHDISGYPISIKNQLPEDDAEDGFGDLFLDIRMQYPETSVKS